MIRGGAVVGTRVAGLGHFCAGDWKQAMGARNRVVPAGQATQPVGIGSLVSILGPLKSLNIRASGY